MSYWAERTAATQAELTTKNIEQTKTQLIKYYGKTQKEIIGQFEKTYNHLLSTMSEGKTPTPADLYKLDTYWQMQAQVKGELMRLGNKQAAILSNNFVKQYQAVYDLMAIKDISHYNTIDTKAAEAMINHIWCADGKSWSDRVWQNTELLQQALNDNLIECVVAGKKPSELKALLQNDFNVSFSRADSLVRTEMAHIQTQAAHDRYEAEGVEFVEIWADKDERRCDVCGKLHEKRYRINEKVPIPAHPRCRCCIIPVVE